MSRIARPRPSTPLLGATLLGAFVLGVTLLGGCTSVAGYSSGPPLDGIKARTDGGVDAPRDATFDAPGDAKVDAARDRGCMPTVDPSVVALYRFEFRPDDVLPNSYGKGPWGSIVNVTDAGRVRYVDGGRCGGALAFGLPATQSKFGHVVLPSSSLWQLPRGSIDFWVRFNAAFSNSRMGVISRDEYGQSTGGHIEIEHESPDGGPSRLRLRMQRLDAGSHHSCGSNLQDGKWHHVAVNFGGSATQLFVDGLLQPSRSASCSADVAPLTVGIDGNDQPWLLGGSNVFAPAGALVPRRPFFGAIDELRISSERRDFTALWPNP